MKKMKLLYLLIPCCYVISVLFVNAATYSVSPLIIDLNLEKRDLITKEITITNMDGRQVRIFPSVNEVNLDENGAIQSFVQPSMEEDRSTAVTSWIQVPRRRIEILPGESATVPVTIKVHPDVKAGEYHALIGFGDGSNQPQAHAKVMNGTAPVTVVRISVDEVQNQFLRLSSFNVKRFVSDNPTDTITYSLDNPGADPVVPGGEIIFYDNNGNEVASTPVNPESLTVEPGKVIEVKGSVPEELGLGKYKAFLSVEFGEHLTASVHDTAFFYVMPLKQLLMIFGAVLALALIIALYVHRRYAGVEEYDDHIVDVPMFIRSERSEGKDHDIDLSKKN